MLPADAADKLLQWELEFSSTREPGAVDSIARPIDIAAPDALEAKQNVTIQMWPNLLQLVGKADYRRAFQALYRSKWPLVLRPFIRSHQLDSVTGFGDPCCKPF